MPPEPRAPVPRAAIRMPAMTTAPPAAAAGPGRSPPATPTPTGMSTPVAAIGATTPITPRGERPVEGDEPDAGGHAAGHREEEGPDAPAAGARQS